MDKNSILLPTKKKIAAIDRIERKHPRFVNMLKRAKKIAGYTIAGTAFLGISSIGSLVSIPLLPIVLSTIGGVGLAGSLYKVFTNIVYQDEKDLMFVAKRGRNNVIEISQKFVGINRIKGLNKVQLSGLMLLNSLVGLERFKSLIDTSKQVEFGDKILYSQEFSTMTHGINLKNFKILERMGYLKIDDVSKVLKQSSLLLSKIGIGEVRNIRQARDALKAKKVDMHEIKFRLTDKKIDLIRLYDEYRNKSRRQQITDRIGFTLFDTENGILSAKNENGQCIGIEYDSLERPVIRYNYPKTGVDIFEEILPKRYSNSEKQQFDSRIHYDLPENAEQIAIEQSKDRDAEFNRKNNKAR